MLGVGAPASSSKLQGHMRKSFIIHQDSLEILDKLSDEQAGKLFKAIKFYQETKQNPNLDFTLDLVFTPFLNQFLRDEQKWKNVVERNRINGSKGGRPRNPVGYLGTQENPEEPKKADSDTKSDSDSKNKNIDSQFELLWQSYKEIHISKGSKKEAKKSFLKALKKASFEEIESGLRKYITDCHSKNSYTKQVSAWLNQECWQNEYNSTNQELNSSDESFLALKLQEINFLVGNVVEAIEIDKNAWKAIFVTNSEEKIKGLNQETKNKIKNIFAEMKISNFEFKKPK